MTYDEMSRTFPVLVDTKMIVSQQQQHREERRCSKALLSTLALNLPSCSLRAACIHSFLLVGMFCTAFARNAFTLSGGVSLAASSQTSSLSRKF